MRDRQALWKRLPSVSTWAARVLALCLLLLPNLAGAERPALPTDLPGGYVLEAQGEVRWVYPESAQDEVDALKAQLPKDLSRLSQTFGSPLSDELDIRVGLNTDDMRQLAPAYPVPDYAEGVAYPAHGLILLTFSAPMSFTRPDMGKVLTHELSHVALHRAVGGHSVPRWFTEGVAIQQADEHSLQRLRVLWESAMAKRLLPLSQLSRDFPGNHHEVSVAYAQSADLVGHMTDGADDEARFRALLGFLREGKGFSEAVQAAYGVSLGYIEREWRSSLMRNYGRLPSLLTGLSLLWALTAVLLLVGYIRARRKHRETLEQWQIEEAAEATAAETMQSPVVLRVTPTERPSVTRTQHRVDEFMDRFQGRASSEGEVPKIEHDGQSHTLH